MEAGHGQGRDEDGAEVLVVTDLELLNGNLSSTGLRLHDPDLPYEAFEELCAYLGERYAMVRSADMALKFAIGDAILAGEELYGERSYQAFESFQLSHEVLKECARVCSRIPHSRRRVTLTWSHHRAVASLPTLQDRQEWLRRAGDEGMSHHVLRAELADRAGENIPPAASPARCSCCGARL
jgi:hypothetical protein